MTHLHHILILNLAVVILLFPTVAHSTSASADSEHIVDSTTFTVLQGTEMIVLRFSVYGNSVWALAKNASTGIACVVNPSARSHINTSWMQVFVNGRRLIRKVHTSSWENHKVIFRGTLEDYPSAGSFSEVVIAGGEYIEDFTFDVSKLTQNNDIEVRLVTSTITISGIQIALNEVSPQPQHLKCDIDEELNSYTSTVSVIPIPDVWTSITRIVHDKKTPTDGNHRLFSIPPRGDTNVHDRTLTLTLDKPGGSSIEHVNARVVPMDMIVTDDQASTNVNDPVYLNSENKVDVRVTDRPSTILTHPPPADKVRYEFNVSTELTNGDFVSTSKESRQYDALWRKPLILARFGDPCTGGRHGCTGHDDWSLQGTYRWLEANQYYIPAVNDISGEHARDIGHEEHESGADIDMFYFSPMEGTENGGRNYRLLACTLTQVYRGDNIARNRIIAWIRVNRQSFEHFLAQRQVGKILFSGGLRIDRNLICDGRRHHTNFNAGWIRSLLNEGMAISSDGRRHVFLPRGELLWEPPNRRKLRYLFDESHTTHMHVSLVPRNF